MRQDFTSIGEVLESSLPSNGKFKYALKMSTLFGLWDQIVGRKFEKSSRPLTIKFSKLYISCQNSYVVQELSMFKSDLLKKIAPYAVPLGLKIEDIILSTKDWSNPVTSEMPVMPDMGKFSKEELEEITIEQDELDALRENIEKLTFLTDEQRKKYYNDIVNTVRAKKLREKLVLE